MSFTINYKGTPKVINYTYQCPKCRGVQTVEHLMQESPEIVCHKCMFPIVCNKVILSPPSLGADHHESMKTRNIGWDE